MNIDFQISERALGFLVWFRKNYNGKLSHKTYIDISYDYKRQKYSAIRTYMLELEAAGYVEIRNKGTHSQIFVVNEEKFQTLI